MVYKKIKSIIGPYYLDLFWHTRNYLLSSVAIKSLGFISIPVLTRLLMPSDYGIVNVFNSYVGILMAVVTLNTYTAVGRYYFEDEKDFDEFFGANIVFNIVLLVVFFTISLLFRDGISRLLNLPTNVILIIIPMVFISISNSWYEQICVPNKQSKKLAIRNIAQAYLIFMLTIGITMYLKNYKYLGPIMSPLLVGLLFSAYYVWDLRQYIKINVKMKHIKYALFYSAPLILYSLSGVILSQFDRILINKYQGNTSAGLYSFAYNIALLQGVFVGAVSLAWMPNFYRYMADGLFEKIEKESGNIIRLYCLASLFLVYFGKEIGLILARPNFHDSLYLVPIIVSGCLFSSLFSFYGWTIAFYKKNIYLSMVVLFCGTISIFLNVLLIPKFGSVIAAVDSMISYAVMLIIAWLVSSKLLKLYSISIVNMLKIVAVYIVFTVIYYGLIWCHFPILLEIMFKLLLISVFVLFLFKNYINRFLKKQ